MVALFQNPNVATALVERLPCAFAPSVNGQMGTHYAMVLLDHKGNVIYVGSECEHTNGEGVQAIHEMGDKDNTLCYVVTAAFRKALATLHNHREETLNIKDHLPKDANILTGHMYHMFSKVWMESVDKHNNHLTRRRNIWTRDDYQLVAMQRTVNNVTSSMLKIPPLEIYTGAHRARVTHEFVRELNYPNVFDVKKWVDPGQCELHFRGNPEVIATRAHGSWAVREDYIKSWAKEHHTTMESVGRTKHLHSDKRCLFCNETFNRMSKHTQGARHIDRVLEVAKMTCKATSRMGLQMINNPRTRSVFIKR